MTDVLTFLNSAELETLTKVSGISRALAGNILAARPFESEEECLKVHGMGPALLERVRAFAEAQGEAPESRALQPVEKEAAPVLQETPPTEKKTRPAGPSFGARVGAFFLSLFRGLVRLIALVIILGALIALGYYGLPMLRSYLLAPVAQNQSEIARLRAEVEAMQTQAAQTNGRVEALEQTAASVTESLAEVANAQAALEQQMEEGNQKLLTELEREITIARAAQYLSRARLYLAQSNFGLAREDVLAARNLLSELQTKDADFKPEAVKAVIARLDLALGNLPAFPVIAAGDVDIALQLLLSGLPEGAAFFPATVTSTPAPAETPTPEATATATPQVTATP